MSTPEEVRERISGLSDNALETLFNTTLHLLQAWGPSMGVRKKKQVLEALYVMMAEHRLQHEGR